MPNALLAKVLRQNQSALLLGTLVLSLILALAGGLVFWLGIRDAQDDRIAEFTEQHERLEVVSNQVSARLMQFVDLYEGIWAFHELDPVPTDRYRRDLVEQGNVLQSGDDLSAIPFTIASDLTLPQERERLALYLRIVRSLSAAPSIDARHLTGIRLTAILYAPDGSFLAQSPALPNAQVREMRKQRVREIVKKTLSSVDPEGVRLSACDVSERPRWIPSSAGGESAAAVIIPMLKDGSCVATLAVSIPSAEFIQHFRNRENRPGFYVFSDKGEPLRYEFRAGGDQRVQTIMAEERNRLTTLDERRQVFWHDGAMVIAQRVSGPRWIALYAIPFQTLLAAIGNAYWFAIALLVLANAFLWGLFLFCRYWILARLAHEGARVAELERFRQTILSTLPIGIVVFSPKENAARYINRIASDLIGSTDGLQHARFCASVLKQHDASTAKAMIEVPWSRSSETRLTLGATVGLTRLNDEDVYLVGFQDVSDKIAREALLESAKRAAEDANRAKSLFLAIVSHEIRTPLHGAMGNLELLASHPLEPDQQLRVQVVRSSFDGLLLLVNDILDATKLELGALTLSPRVAIVNETVERCLQNLSSAILGKGLTLAWSAECRLHQAVVIDDHRLSQIVQNLLSNAFKFTEKGGIAVQTQLVCDQNDREVMIVEVCDTGIGMAPQALAHIFEPMMQADASISRRFGGTGLGLYLCRTLIELMGGTIEVRSELGDGTRFRIALPVTFATPSPGTSSDAPSSSLPSLLGMRICIERTGSTEYASWREQLHVLGADTSAERHSCEVVIAPYDVPYRDAVIPADIQGVNRYILTPDGPATRRQISATSWHLTSLDGMRLIRYLNPALNVPFDESLVVPALSGSFIVSTYPDVSIIVADDDDVSRLLLNDQLSHLGFKDVRVARNGVQALALHEVRRANALFVDLNMPDLDGLELVRRLRRGGDPVAVIVVTASGGGELGESAREFTDVLHKPVSLASLHEVLAKWRLTASQGNTGTGEPEHHVDENAAIFDRSIEKQMRAAFSAAWSSDRIALDRAVTAADKALQSRLLHRVSGALAALGEQTLADEAQRLCGDEKDSPAMAEAGAAKQFIDSVDALMLRIMVE